MIPTEAVDILACYRLTRLATADTITRPLRVRIIRHAYERRAHQSWLDGGVTHATIEWSASTESEWDDLPHNDDDAPKLAAFIVCPWCTGLWISGFVVLARRYAAVLWDPLARALALSAAAALLARLEDQ